MLKSYLLIDVRGAAFLKSFIVCIEEVTDKTCKQFITLSRFVVCLILASLNEFCKYF